MVVTTAAQQDENVEGTESANEAIREENCPRKIGGEINASGAKTEKSETMIVVDNTEGITIVERAKMMVGLVEKERSGTLALSVITMMQSRSVVLSARRAAYILYRASYYTHSIGWRRYIRSTPNDRCHYCR